MLSRDTDPIVAVATAPGRGAVGIVRISGRGLGPLVQRLCGRTLTPRVATLTPFLDAQGQPLDEGLALYFPAPHSYTGEDVLELQGHGGPVVLQLLVQRCLEAASVPAPACLPALRLAEPGEFTRRAFLNDKLDLAQAEAVADLIDAGTEAAARSATRSLQGELSRRMHELAERILRLRMLVEATLDFPEEEIDFLQKADAQGQLRTLRTALQQALQHTRQGVLLREGLRVVIAGQPNVGKSSLLNALAQQEVAIVTPIAGTTRDRIEQSLQIQGVPLQVVDTAGLREPEDASDAVERIGIERSWQAIQAADVVLRVRDLSRNADTEAQAADARIDAQLAAHGVRPERLLPVWNKCDTAGAALGQLGVSAKTGEGLDALRAQLLERAGWESLPEGVSLARTRHLDALRRCSGHLDAAQEWLDQDDGALDLLAEELRLAHRALGEITGQVLADDLLGVIFSSFCIGK